MESLYGSDLGCLSYNITRWLSIRSKLNAAAVA